MRNTSERLAVAIVHVRGAHLSEVGKITKEDLAAFYRVLKCILAQITEEEKLNG